MTRPTRTPAQRDAARPHRGAAPGELRPLALTSDYAPAGDQPEAIAALIDNLGSGL